MHDHKHRRLLRTTLLLILGSSPMVEGIPAFFAAGKYGVGLIAVMALVFALATIATYITLCVTSIAGLQRMSFGPLERYGEVLSGAFIAIVGLVFLIFPILETVMSDGIDPLVQADVCAVCTPTERPSGGTLRTENGWVRAKGRLSNLCRERPSKDSMYFAMANMVRRRYSDPGRVCDRSNCMMHANAEKRGDLTRRRG